MVYVASVSFGKDSLAMLLKILEEGWPLDYVVFFDTGAEFQAIYNNAEKIKPLLKERGIEFKTLKPNEDFFYNMLERKINTRDSSEKIGRGWCGGNARWGTSEKMTKIDSCYNDLSRGYETIVSYVGIAADESERIARERNELKINIYPLIEWNMTEADCLQYCYDRGWNWLERIDNATSEREPQFVELYSVLDRVSCWCCRNKNKVELRNMYNMLPNYWARLRDLQDKIEQPFKNYGSIYELEAEFKAENEAVN